MRTDQDLYNFTMGQLVWRNFPDVEVSYAFKCRSDIDLCKLIDIDMLNEELSAIQKSKLSEGEKDVLMQLGIFDPYYLDWLMKSVLTMPEVKIIDEKIEIQVSGPWATGIFWETPILYTVNHVIRRGFEMEHDPVVTGMERLQDKVQILKQNPQIKFFDFGTRRRYSHSWQFNVLGYVQAMCPENILGTSNVYMGSLLGIPVRGTIAHQLYMVNAALELQKDRFIEDAGAALAGSLRKIDELWEDEFAGLWDNGLMMGLPDTFGSEYYFRQLKHTDFSRWRGFRQDSGDPLVFADRVMHHWGLHGIDPSTKLLAFSDGLDLETMLKLYEVYGSETNVVFGWGTNLTNDVGLEPISMVVKPFLANGAPCVKLSDNLEKATGDPNMISIYKSLTEYTNSFSQKAKY